MNKPRCPECDELRATIRRIVELASDQMSEWDADRFTPEGKLLSALAGDEAGYHPDIDAIHRTLKRGQP
jgi:hypothetical protein